MVWIDSRDRHLFAKHCLTTKGGSCSFSHSKYFRIAHPSRIPRTLHCLSTLWVSCSPPVPENSLPPVCHGSLVWAMWCGAQSVPAVSKCTYEGGHLTSCLASARALQVVHDSCSLFLAQQKEFLAPSSTRAVAFYTTCFTEPDTFFTTSHCTFIDLKSQFAS